MRRTLAVLALAGLVAAGTASASTVLLDADTMQASTATGTSVSCDDDGINTNWVFEKDDNSVRTVRFVDIDTDCVGDELFVEIFDEDDNLIYESSKVLAADNVSFSLAKATTPVSWPTPQSIGSVKIWIEG